MTKFLAFFLTFLFVSTASAQTYVAESQDFVNEFLTKISVVLSDSNLADQEKQNRIHVILNDDIAFNGIARFVLGRYWRSASQEEREEYLVLFKAVVINTTLTRVSQLEGQIFEVIKSELLSTRGNEVAVLVRTRISTSEKPVNINWRVSSNGESYKITDVYVMGISLATTYRDEFTSVVRRDGMTGLLNKLREMRTK